jgi:hypothetical protein
VFEDERKEFNSNSKNTKLLSMQNKSIGFKSSPIEMTGTTIVCETIDFTSSHVSTNKNIMDRLGYFAKLRTMSSAMSLHPLEKATAHVAQYLAMDPLEKMRRQVEQTLKAKLGLLQTKLDNSRDPKNKTQRKIYVGNLSPNINGEFLKQLFTQTLSISYPQWNTSGQDSVVEVQYRDGNKYCFLELRTIEMATAALQVNGVSVLGTQLQVSRSTGFLDPSECERAVKEVEQELARFLSREDEGPLLRQPGFAELVAKIKINQVGIYQHHEKENLKSGLLSEYLTLDCIITASSLNSAVQLQDILEDIKTKDRAWSWTAEFKEDAVIIQSRVRYSESKPDLRFSFS